MVENERGRQRGFTNKIKIHAYFLWITTEIGYKNNRGKSWRTRLLEKKVNCEKKEKTRKERLHIGDGALT